MNEVKSEVINIDVSPAEMIKQAVQGGADLDKLEKLLQLQEKWESNQARKAFAASFAEAQKNILSVTKTKTNSQTHSKYADLGDVIESSKPIYTAEGFSVIFYEGDTPLAEHIRIYADVLHGMGHKETYHYDVPMDGKGIRGNENMTKIHAKASSTAYGRRYLMCMIWNIPTQDNDGNSVDVETINEKQLANLRDQLAELDKKEDMFCTYLEVDKLEELPLAKLNKAQSALDAARDKKKAGK